MIQRFQNFPFFPEPEILELVRKPKRGAVSHCNVELLVQKVKTEIHQSPGETKKFSGLQG